MKEWTGRHGMHMVIRLDHGVGDEDYEEVIALQTDIRSSCFLLIWRSTEAVTVQPLVGRPLPYRSVGHVLDSLVANQNAEMTNTTAPE